MNMDLTNHMFECSGPNECDIASHGRDGVADDLMRKIKAI